MSLSYKNKRVLPKLSSKQVVEENRTYVHKRAKGEIKSLRTKYSKLNRSLMGGLELDTITCISALSGAGKSTLSKTFRDSISDLNKDQDFRQYLINMEMVAHQQIGRSMVAMTRKSLYDLYSIEKPLSAEDLAFLDKYYTELAARDIQFIEEPGTAEEIVDSLAAYWETECKDKGLTMVYEIDHALLTLGLEGQSEKQRVDELMYRLVALKKYIVANGGHSVGLVLSQMNREIRSVDRIRNKDMHKPDTGCLFGASSIEQCCDYIIFVHMPAMLGIQQYTVDDLPTVMRYENSDEKIMIPYFELVKQRSGKMGITIPLINKLHLFDFEEMDKGDFMRLHEALRLNPGVVPVLTTTQTLLQL
jgi:hypothetical protein